MPKSLFTVHQPLKMLYSVITAAALLLLSACGGSGGGSSSGSNNNQNNPPVLTVASNPLVFNVGIASTSTIAGSGGAPTSCSVDNLPAGLSTSVADTGCVISGIATIASAQSSYTLTAINNDGTATATFALQVIHPPALTTPSNTLIFAVGIASTSTIAGSGGAPTSCSVDSLPTGLSTSVAGNGCVISGIATTASAQSTYTLSASNQVGTSTITISLGSVTSPVLIQPDTLIFQINVTNSITIMGRGSTPTTCSIDGLPAGLTASVSGNGCAISGTASAPLAPSNHILTATNDDGTDTITITLRVIHPPALTTPSNTLIFAVGMASTSTIAGSGGAPTSCSANGLPAGLSTSVAGNGCAISGIATTASAQSSYTLTATNQDGVATITITLHVIHPPALTTPSNTLVFAVGIASTSTIAGSGGTPDSCSVDSLPAGLSTSVAGNGCVISGIATTASAQSDYTLIAANQDGSSTITISLSAVTSPVLIQPDTLIFQINVTNSITIMGRGTTPTTCSIDGLPAGLSASVSGTGCAIGGTAITTATQSSYTLSAANDNGTSTIIIALSVLNPPILTTPSATFIFGVGLASTNTVAGNGGTPTSCSIANPPTGFIATVAGDGCAIHGIASSATAQSSYTLTAANNDGSSTIIVSIAINIPNDGNANGLIEIYTLTQLHNMRYSLDGSRYKTSSTDTGSALGCPNDACIGYELMNDLDFDTDGDGTWTQGGSGNYRLNTNDSATPYFIVNANGTGGWLPVGDSANAFNTIFEGNGYAIYNLAIRNGLANIGLFGVINANASIRNIGLVNNLSNYMGDRSSAIGGLVGQQNGGTISASYATGDAYGDSLGLVDIGGLVGSQEGGRIIASYATGDVNGGRRFSDTGGLVGQPKPSRQHNRQLCQR